MILLGSLKKINSLFRFFLPLPSPLGPLTFDITWLQYCYNIINYKLIGLPLKLVVVLKARVVPERWESPVAILQDWVPRLMYLVLALWGRTWKIPLNNFLHWSYSDPSYLLMFMCKEKFGERCQESWPLGSAIASLNASWLFSVVITIKVFFQFSSIFMTERPFWNITMVDVIHFKIYLYAFHHVVTGFIMQIFQQWKRCSHGVHFLRHLRCYAVKMKLFCYTK